MDYLHYKEYSCSIEDGLISNWPFKNIEPKQPKPIKIYYVDGVKSGNTVAKFDDVQSAKKYIKKFGGILRLYAPTPEERDAELEATRMEKRFHSTRPYKARTIRRKKK